MEFAFGQRFASAFGSPNLITPGNYCGVQNTESLRYTFGCRYIMARMENAKVIILWGANLAHTGGTFSNIPRYQFNRALVSGETKVVVIDPKNIELWPEKGMHASDADYWICPRPNSDGILAMGFVKVLVEEGLFDEEYLNNWTIGFPEIPGPFAFISSSPFTISTKLLQRSALFSFLIIGRSINGSSKLRIGFIHDKILRYVMFGTMVCPLRATL